MVNVWNLIKIFKKPINQSKQKNALVIGVLANDLNHFFKVKRLPNIMQLIDWLNFTSYELNSFRDIVFINVQKFPLKLA